MKKLLLLLAFVPLFSIAQFKVPERIPNTYVFDYTGNTLSAGEIADLNKRIIKLKDSSSIEVAVVVLNDLQGYDVDAVALAIFNKWGIGKDGLDNGILYLVSPANRTHRIEVGYGMEGEIPAIVAKNILTQGEAYFKQGDVPIGIRAIVNRIIDTVDPAIKVQKAEWARQQRLNAERAWRNFLEALPYVLAIILGLCLIIYLVYKDIKKRNAIKLAKGKEEAYLSECMRYRAGVEHIRKTTDINKKREVLEVLAKKLEKVDYNPAFYMNRVKKYILGYPHLSEIEMKIGKTQDAVDHCKSVHSSLSACLDAIEATERDMKNMLLTINKENSQFNEIREDLPKLKRTAQDELHNTPYKKDALKHDLYMEVMAWTGLGYLMYPKARAVRDSLLSIINYKRDKKEREQQLKREEEHREKKRISDATAFAAAVALSRNDDDDDDDRSRSSSSYSSDSSSSSSSFDFGGGSSGGGGASSSW